MKKSLLFLAIGFVVISFMAFGFVNWNDETEVDIAPDITIGTNFIYNVDSRFVHRITKEDLHNAKSIVDIVPEKGTKNAKSFHETEVTVYKKADRIIERGEGQILSVAQLDLIRSTDYSADLQVRANYTPKNSCIGGNHNNDLSYAMTIVPENEAEYVGGHEALISYLRMNSMHATIGVNQNQLNPGRIRFTVDEKGSITDASLDSKSGFEFIDKTMLHLIKNMPGKWTPATNSNGDKVQQELVFFYGQEGC